jgi:hypothetical protein
MVTSVRIVVLVAFVAIAGLALASEFYKLPTTTTVQDRDIYLLRRPAAAGFDNNTGSRNITGGNLRKAFGNQTTSWAKITGKPAFATVATTGSYPDLTNRPTIPTACVDVFDGRDSTVPGPPGKSVLSGTSDPIASDGTDGDFFINTVTATLFGPKASGAWPVGISLVGPQGIQGPPGPPGTVDQPTVLSVIATQTDGAMLEMQQGLTEAGTAPKLSVSDRSGTMTFYVDGAGTLTVKKLVIQ